MVIIGVRVRGQPVSGSFGTKITLVFVQINEAFHMPQRLNETINILDVIKDSDYVSHIFNVYKHSWVNSIDITICGEIILADFE